MEWLVVIGLITIGLLLLIVEILFVPGTTIIGILGFLIEISGVYMGYDYFGNKIGSMILGITFIVSFATIFVSFKSGLWNKFALKDLHSGKVNEGLHNQLSVGDQGVTMSSLKPIGKAIFKDVEYEVRTNGAFLEDNVPVAIIKIEENKIIVEPLKQ